MACEHSWDLKYRLFGPKLVCRACGVKRRVKGSTLCLVLAFALDYLVWPEIKASMATSFVPFLQAKATQIAAEALLLAASWSLLSLLQYGIAAFLLKKRGQVPEAWLGDI